MQYGHDLTSYSTEELRGVNKLVPVRNYQWYTTPFDIYLEYRLDLTKYDVTQLEPILDEISQGVTEVAGRDDVGAVIYQQDTNLAGQLIDQIVVVVLSTSGLSSQEQVYPLADVVALSFGTSTSAKEPSIPEIVALLDSIEALAPVT